MRTLLSFLTVGWLLMATGCTTLDLTGKAWDWARDKDEKDKKKSEYEQPARMVAVWTDTVYYSSGGQPTRGFGGRLYFYNAHSQAIPVEGQLAVFVYDDTDVPAEQLDNRPPDRRYAFTQEQFSKHFSKTDLGASYSVWIPWDRVGGEERHLTLIPVFTSVDGKVLMGAQSAHVLPGRPRNTENVARNGRRAYEGRPVAYEAEAPAENSSALRTTTISVPRNGAIRNSWQRPNPMVDAARLNSASTPATGPMMTQSWHPQQARPLPWQGPANQLQPQPAPSMQPSTVPGAAALPQQPYVPVPGAVPSLPAASHSLPASLPPQAMVPGSFQAPTMGQPGAHFERPRSRALGGPIARLDRDPAPSALSPAAQPYLPPSPPAPASLGAGGSW